MVAGKLKPLFMHHNMYKPDPKRILEMDGSMAKTNDGKYSRMSGELKRIVDWFGYDLERRVWEVMRKIVELIARVGSVQIKRSTSWRFLKRLIVSMF